MIRTGSGQDGSESGRLRIGIDLLPTQLRYLMCEAKYPAYIGGYGAGKTFALCVKAILEAVRNPGLPGMVVAPTYRDLRDVTLRMLRELLERFGIPSSTHWTHYKVTLPWWGSEIWLRGADEPDSLKGANVAWAGIDEVARIDEEVWPVLVSRVRHPGAQRKQVFAAGTPEGLNWVYKRWVEEKTEDYELFQASTLENSFLDPRYAVALSETHGPEETRQKLYGEFVSVMSGRVYKWFDRREHVVESSPLVEGEGSGGGAGRIVRHLPLALACDFNIDPCVWLVVQHWRGAVFVADEIALRDTTTQEMIEEFFARGYGGHPSGITVYGDPGGRSRTVSSSMSDYELLRRAGLRQQAVAKAAPAVRDRVSAVNRLLRGGRDGTKLRRGAGAETASAEPRRVFPFTRPESAASAEANPRLLVWQGCKCLIRDFERVRWQEGGSVPDKSDRELTHASDALGYFIDQVYPIRSARRVVSRLSEVLS